MIHGKAVKLGNHVDTDVIIPAKYCTSIDAEFLGTHLLETYEPEIRGSFLGTILVAGSNFGCGSAREHAALAVAGAGIVAVVARTFSRTFFRNAVNIAFPVFELDAVDEIHPEDDLEIDPSTGVLRNVTRDKNYNFAPYPAIIQEIMDAGGMIEFARRRLKQKATINPHS